MPQPARRMGRATQSAITPVAATVRQPEARKRGGIDVSIAAQCPRCPGGRLAEPA